MAEAVERTYKPIHGSASDYCCLKRYIALRLEEQGVSADSISEIVMLGRQRGAENHVKAVYSIMAGLSNSMVDANAEGLVRLLGLHPEDGAELVKLNAHLRKRRYDTMESRCECWQLSIDELCGV